MNTKELIESGYTIENVKIASADLIITENYGCVSFELVLDGDGWRCSYGGYCLGHCYSWKEEFDASSKGLEYMIRVMDIAEVSRLSDLEGKYVRVAYKELDDSVNIIGNIIRDKWLNLKEFFAKEKLE